MRLIILLKNLYHLLLKKIDDINESTKQLGEIVTESNSVNNKETIVIPSILLQETFISLTKTPSSLKLNHDKDGNLTILGAPIKSLGGDKVRVYDNIYEFNPEIHRALSLSSYTGKSMKNENDRRTLYIFLTDIGYTGDVDGRTNQINFFKKLFKQFRNI